MWKNTEAVSVPHQDIKVSFSIDIDIFFIKTHFITFFLKQQELGI